MTNLGVGVYAVYLAAELEEGESAGSVINFLWIDVDSLARHIILFYILDKWKYSNPIRNHFDMVPLRPALSTIQKTGRPIPVL